MKWPSSRFQPGPRWPFACLLGSQLTKQLSAGQANEGSPFSTYSEAELDVSVRKVGSLTPGLFSFSNAKMIAESSGRIDIPDPMSHSQPNTATPCAATLSLSDTMGYSHHF